MKSEILGMLRVTDGYLSGRQPCDKMEVSRAAVWKAMNELKKEGYRTEAVCNRGYHLMEDVNVITRAELQSMFHSKWTGGRLGYFDETDSTNTRVRKLTEEGATHSTLVVADSQWAGRDRGDRLWTSPKGVGIWMSMVLRPTIPPLHTSILTLIAGMAVVKRVRSFAGLNAIIERPNDMVLEGEKIYGVLTEMSMEGERIRHVITGIGTNVNIDEFPGELVETATSPKLGKGKNIRRSPIINTVAEAFEGYYDVSLETCDMSILREEYNRELVNTNGEVMMLDPKGQYKGTVLGIDNEGSLLVGRKDGTVTSVISGEVSVRGIYGYVWSKTSL